MIERLSRRLWLAVTAAALGLAPGTATAGIDILSISEPNPSLYIDDNSMHPPGKPTEQLPYESWSVQVLDASQFETQWDIWDQNRTQSWSNHGAFCTNLAANWLKRLKGAVPIAPLAPFSFHDGQSSADRLDIVKLNLQWELGCGVVRVKQKQWLMEQFKGTTFQPADVLGWVEATKEGAGTRIFLGTDGHALGLYVVDDQYAIFYDPDVGLPVKMKRRAVKKKIGWSYLAELNYALIPAGETDPLTTWITSR
jgi:hypothetical protein